MKLQYYQGIKPNFGDDLNPWLWPQLLPNFFDNDSSYLFIGIGSILGEPYEASAKKVVVGSGYVPSYHAKAPNVHSADWEVLFVRGPRTARLLGLPQELGIGDSAMLLRALNLPWSRVPSKVGFIPHWESIGRGNWQQACASADIQFIDPTAPVEDVIAGILQCKMIICEAMHGAIVADVLRVPWIPVLPIGHVHREKWQDWGDSLGLTLKPDRLLPSSSGEMEFAAVNWPFLSSVSKSVGKRPLSWIAEPLFVEVAARRLALLAKKAPQLSADDLIDSLVERMLVKIRAFEKRYKRG